MKPRVVIVGGGFAGLSALLVLLKSGVDMDIKLVEEKRYFEYIPSLHLCLNNSAYFGKVRVSLERHYMKWYHRERLMKVNKRSIVTDKSRHDFDYLVLGTGSRTALFADNKYAYGLKSIRDAILINDRLAHARKVAVIGGGYTGVEIAGVLSDRGFGVSIVHGGKHLVNRTVGKAVKEVLEEKGVDVFLNARAKNCAKSCVVLNNGKRVAADLIITAGGVVPTDYVKGRLEGLHLKKNPNVLLCGDAASTGRLMTAHNAMIEGRLAGKRILHMITGEKFKNKGKDWKTLAIALGVRDGIVTSGRRYWKSKWTGLMKWVVERRVIFEFRHKKMLWV